MAKVQSEVPPGGEEQLLDDAAVRAESPAASSLPESAFAAEGVAERAPDEAEGPGDQAGEEGQESESEQVSSDPEWPTEENAGRADGFQSCDEEEAGESASGPPAASEVLTSAGRPPLEQAAAPPPEAGEGAAAESQKAGSGPKEAKQRWSRGSKKRPTEDEDDPPSEHTRQDLASGPPRDPDGEGGLSLIHI